MTKEFTKHLTTFVATSLIAGSILTVMAPYGTLRMDLPSRALYWVGLCAAGGLGAQSLTFICARIGVKLSVVALTLCQSLGATLFVSLFLIGLDYSQSGQVTLVHVVITIFYVWIIAVTLCAISNLIGNRQNSSIPPPERAALFERLKPPLRASDIYALSAEDHYVRVHTSNGDDLILMRLSDAIREVAPLIGLSTHRSWWVSEVGVKSVSRKDGKTSITLHSDIEVPVSRNRNKDVKEAGWV